MHRKESVTFHGEVDKVRMAVGSNPTAAERFLVNKGGTASNSSLLGWVAFLFEQTLVMDGPPVSGWQDAEWRSRRECKGH